MTAPPFGATSLPEELAHFILCFACGHDCSEGEALQDLTFEIIQESAYRLRRLDPLLIGDE